MKKMILLVLAATTFAGYSQYTIQPMPFSGGAFQVVGPTTLTGRPIAPITVVRPMPFSAPGSYSITTPGHTPGYVRPTPFSGGYSVQVPRPIKP